MPIFTTDPTLLLIAGVLGYLLGSIPFGMVLARVMGLGNLRDIGSGNIGATNVLRTGSKKAAAATARIAPNPETVSSERRQLKPRKAGLRPGGMATSK